MLSFLLSPLLDINFCWSPASLICQTDFKICLDFRLVHCFQKGSDSTRRENAISIPFFSCWSSPKLFSWVLLATLQIQILPHNLSNCRYHFGQQSIETTQTPFFPQFQIQHSTGLTLLANPMRLRAHSRFSYQNGRWLQNKKWKEQRKVDPWPWFIPLFLQHWMLFILASIGMVVLLWMNTNFIFDCLTTSNTNWLSLRYFYAALASPPPSSSSLLPTFSPSLVSLLFFCFPSLALVLTFTYFVCSQDWDWYFISNKKFMIPHGGFTLLLHYRSLFNMLKSLHPSIQWHESKFLNMNGKEFWNSRDNRRTLMDIIGQQLSIHQVSFCSLELNSWT